MTVLRTTARVDADGNVVVPVGASEAGREVVVTIAPAPKMTEEQWRQFVRETAGSIADPTFKRHPQGTPEIREALE